jgi:hypothetical protein
VDQHCFYANPDPDRHQNGKSDPDPNRHQNDDDRQHEHKPGNKFKIQYVKQGLRLAYSDVAHWDRPGMRWMTGI